MMKMRLCLLFSCAVLVAACSTQELGSAAYGSLGANECKEKTGGLACDLDERTTDERLNTGAPDEQSSEALAKQAEKIRAKNAELDKN